MITLNRINLVAVNTIDYVTYLGTEFGDCEVVDSNLWHSQASAPFFAPIKRHKFSDATVKFLVSGTPSALVLENTITKLVGMFRVERPDLDYSEYHFVGHCTDVDIKRIGRQLGAEVTLTVKGFKYVSEIYNYQSSSGTVTAFDNVVIESPLSIELTRDMSITIGDETITVSSSAPTQLYLDSEKFTITGLDGLNYSGCLDKLVFPTVPNGGITFSATKDISLRCKRRLM